MRSITRAITAFALFLIVCASRFTQAYEHVHPVPTIPSDVNPATATDVFSVSVTAQIHETLFKLKNNFPAPNLVGHFIVSRDQLRYDFTLKRALFHDGRLLNHQDVKASLEYIVKKRSPGYEKISSLRGFEDFLAGRSNHISGIILGKKPEDFSFVLTASNPLLITNLCEFRFSIVSSTSPGVGLGKYEMNAANADEIRLHRVTNDISAPEWIRYVKATKSAALHEFSQGVYHDLFSFPVSASETTGIIGARTQKVYSPRTYLFSINARTVRDKAARSALLQHLSRTTLIQECYPGNVQTENLIPPGFIGHANTSPAVETPPPLPDIDFQGPFRIAIADGVDAEECVKKRLATDFTGIPGHTISLLDTDELVSQWSHGDLDAFFVYFDSENVLDFFQYFNPDAQFNMGVPGDTAITAMLEAYNRESDPVVRNGQAENLSRHVLELKTILPLFHPEQYVVYDGRYEPLNIGVKSTTFIEFSELKRSAP